MPTVCGLGGPAEETSVANLFALRLAVVLDQFEEIGEF